MKKIQIVTIIVFFMIIGGVSVGSLLAKDRTFSSNENRYLTERPKYRLSDFMSGEFQEHLEEYLNDQILGRDAWISAKTAIQSACRETDIGGAYLGKKGYDFEKITEDDVNRRLFDENVEAVSEYFAFCSARIEPSRLSFLLIPTSGLIMKEYLPANAPMFDQKAYLDDVAGRLSAYNYIDVCPILTEHRKDGIYYHTDHHWTTKGAYFGYAAWCEATGHLLHAEEEYTVTTVSDDFRGSLYSKILNYNSVYDKIDSYTRSASAARFQVVGDGKEAEGFYDLGKLSEKDQYAYFFGGNYGEMVITRTEPASSAGEERNLLVIKDSFANAFLPFIAEEYDHVYVLDLRYYSGETRHYIEEKGITDILVLYNISNFISDKSIYKLMD